ncbi:hypothetical protein BJ878DRAFT_493355 [Calycina marina]|uniref:FAD dependent oxidoreductase domain-containing protein n=1 Tax=Calycina marina TaxID=1763456 RepID=A0A9P7Z973_9HELO|nr:hypothetical protein BJ878DRAFT_493355 [Calycina marina]
MASEEKKHIIILGAGVTGLQTALSLLTSPSTSHYSISIIAAQVPGDLAAEYTSPWAGGHWRSHATTAPEDKETREWDLRTYQYWTSLLQGKEGKVCGIPGCESRGEDDLGEMVFARMKATGLGFKESRNYWGKESLETIPDGSGLWWSSAVSSFQILNLLSESQLTCKPNPSSYSPHVSGGIPTTALFGVKYQSICINVPQYLTYLFSLVHSLGASVLQAHLDTSSGLQGVVEDVKRVFVTSPENSEDEGEKIAAVVNCMGLTAAKFLPEVEAEKSHPIRGQTILVKGEAAMARTFTDFGGGDELVYVIPRPGSKSTVLGGCKQAENYSSEIDEELSARILARIKEHHLADELLGDDGEFKILSTQVGFRPGRKGGSRVEIDTGGKIRGVSVIHSYGHAGAGYQNSVGSAEKIVRLVAEL